MDLAFLIAGSVGLTTGSGVGYTGAGGSGAGGGGGNGVGGGVAGPPPPKHIRFLPP